MLGAIIGDVIGSAYEFHPTKELDFPLFTARSTFTDDTVLTVAVASCLLDNKDYLKTLKDFTFRYPNRGYGSKYHSWAHSADNQPYNSFGNGSAMRVNPVGFAFLTREEVLAEAKKSAMVTHNHPEGIKGAQAVALAIFLAWQGASKYEIKTQIESDFGYDLQRDYFEIQPDYDFDVTCQGSVPEALIAFLDSNNFEDAIRKAVALGGDADTQACIAGGVAEAFYKEIPARMITQTANLLPQEFIEIIERFYLKYLGIPGKLKG
jgi:ADP-ribosyl-[dinitrogen reductase] hydrolase